MDMTTYTESCITGAESQVLQTIMCVVLPYELLPAPVRADGLPFGQHVTPQCSVPHVLQVCHLVSH
jgi:hypothetical protein